MNIAFVSIILGVIYLSLLVIDRKIKGNFSILRKVLSLAFVCGFIAFFVMFYGQSIFQTVMVDFKSFTNLRQFFNSRIVSVLAIILIYLFIFLKMFYVTFIHISAPKTERAEKTFKILSVVFDIAVIPNIVLATSFSTLVVVPAIISIILTGLVFIERLVFCIFKGYNFAPVKKEVLA